jgi:ABC-type nitrate/sulfonate/bicarbonate transport system permease component
MSHATIGFAIGTVFGFVLSLWLGFLELVMNWVLDHTEKR